MLYVPVTAVGAIIGEHIDQLVSDICRNHSHTSGNGMERTVLLPVRSQESSHNAGPFPDSLRMIIFFLIS